MASLLANHFIILPLPTTNTHAYHYLYMIKESSTTFPSNRTLKVLNLPLYSSKQQLTNLFKPVGSISSISFSMDDSQQQQQLDYNPNSTTAWIVFKSSAALDRVLDVVSSNSWDKTQFVSTGLNAYLHHYKANRPLDRSQMKLTATQIIQQYDSAKKQNLTDLKSRTVDRDGFILVKHHNNKSSSSSIGVGRDLAKRDFYTFQTTLPSAKQNQLLELRAKFQADKRKIELLKRTRRFKPY